MARAFDDLVAEGDSAAVDGWDFSWLEGRATEQRPSWGYQRLMSQRLAAASSALDIQTGGGARSPRRSRYRVACRSWSAADRTSGVAPR